MSSLWSYLLIAVLFLFTIYLLFSSSTEYVCYDGTVQDNARDCPTLPTLRIDQRVAERNVDNYGNAVSRALGYSFNRVSVYREGANFRSSVLFTDNVNRNIIESILQVNGTTGSVSCVEGCDFLNKEVEEELEDLS